MTLSLKSFEYPMFLLFYIFKYLAIDIKQKKRLAFHQVVRGNTDEKLKQALYQANKDWLDRYQITQQKLALSDNYYFDGQGLVLVYPAGKLSKPISDMGELKVPYTALSEIIRLNIYRFCLKQAFKYCANKLQPVGQSLYF